VNRIILDLRDNLGGRVGDAVKLIGFFIKKKNKLFLTLDYKEGNDRSKKEFISTHRGEYADWKGAILVNKNSASASEIVAGALQLEGFKLFGERTYGKGSAQSVTQLNNGGGFKLTIAIYSFSNGKSPNGIGLMPDMEISNQPTPMKMVQDPQLDAALHYLQSVD
jgi:carboxyl-terminal processing protease